MKSLALLVALSTGGGCMALSPQLPPTDFAAIERVSDRQAREDLYTENAINTHDEPQGTRYSKGTSTTAPKRSWQSLDVVLRSDASSAAALPKRSLRLSRLFTALTIACGILTVAGVAASAREGLDLQDIDGTGAVLLAGGIATVGFGITAGIFYGRTKTGYQKAVALYNDSLAVRLGINTPQGEYIPPRGVLVDEEGFVVLDERERAAIDAANKTKSMPVRTKPEPTETEALPPAPEGPTPPPEPAPAEPAPPEPEAPAVAPPPATRPAPAPESAVPPPPSPPSPREGVAQGLTLLPKR